jgi:hypothetical protein
MSIGRVSGQAVSMTSATLHGTHRVRCLPVRESIARDIAVNFTTERSRVDDPLVRAAYAQLRSQTDRMFRVLTDARPGRGYQVVFTDLPSPYASDLEMLEAVTHSRLLEVTTAAATPERQHPLLDCSRGGSYDRFRAVHDLIGHIIPWLGFTRDEEYTVWLLQHGLHSGLARWALAMELHGENSVLWTTGQLAEHKAILLHPRLLRSSRRTALSSAS